MLDKNTYSPFRGFFRPMLMVAAGLFSLGFMGCAQHSHACTDRGKPVVVAADPQPAAIDENDETSDTATVKKLLILGDSMTGWMAERFNEYGKINGFEVSTVIWDGSTVSKWASSPKLSQIIAENDPDAVFICLGMNELFESNPQANIRKPVETILEAIGDKPFLWVGPPSWPGHSEGEIFNSWMENELGASRYYRSDSLSIPRQSKSNPHPSRSGMEIWVDNIAEWIPEHAAVKFDSLDKPEPGKISRPAEFTYKRMKENL